MFFVRSFRFWLALFGISGWSTACRNQETLAPVVFEEPSVTPTNATPELTAPWKTVTTSILTNGSLVQWLLEPGQSAFHFRLILPTSIHGDRLDAASVATVLLTLERSLDRKIRRLGGNVSSRMEIGRAELSIYCPEQYAGQALRQLGRILRDRKISQRLLQTQGKFVAKLQEDPIQHAIATLNASQLKQAVAREYATRSDFVALSKSKLERAWFALLDPRDSIVIVHAGQEAKAFEPDLAALSDAWKGRAWLRKNREDKLWPRLWGPGQVKLTKNSVGRKSLSKTPLQIADLARSTTKGQAPSLTQAPLTVVMVRTVPLATPRDRALAHLAYRLSQEEFSLTMAISQNTAIFCIVFELNPDKPDSSLQSELDRLESFLTTAHDEHRLSQAIRIWIGTLWTRASLNGEDWTELWSESMNLATSATQLPQALTKHATTMFAIEPQSLLEWQKQWLSPTHTQSGWVWSVVGSNAKQQKALQHRIDPP